ncbi:hypothetical protein IWZ00DRAFT_384285 [Phyllosticta capitalensis]
MLAVEKFFDISFLSILTFAAPWEKSWALFNAGEFNFSNTPRFHFHHHFGHLAQRKYIVSTVALKQNHENYRELSKIILQFFSGDLEFDAPAEAVDRMYDAIYEYLSASGDQTIPKRKLIQSGKYMTNKAKEALKEYESQLELEEHMIFKSEEEVQAFIASVPDNNRAIHKEESDDIKAEGRGGDTMGLKRNHNSKTGCSNAPCGHWLGFGRVVKEITTPRRGARMLPVLIVSDLVVWQSECLS